MIKIRYLDPDELSPGLHAAARKHGRTTIVFLLPGLTAAERRAALRRLRLSARMGYCPPLPAAQLVLALGADRIRTKVGQVGTLIRSHPAGSTVPVMLLSAGAIAFLALSAVSIQVLHIPRDRGGSSALAVTGGSPTPVPGSASPPSAPAPGSSGPADPGPWSSPSTSPASASSPRSLPPATSSSGPSPDIGVTASIGTANPTPSPEAAPTTAAPAASPSGSPAMRTPPSPSSTCATILGVCP